MEANLRSIVQTWEPGNPYPWFGECNWDLNDKFKGVLKKRKSKSSPVSAGKRGRKSPGMSRLGLPALNLTAGSTESGGSASGGSTSGEDLQSAAEETSPRTPNSTGGELPDVHPLDVAPSSMTRFFLYARHPGAFIRQDKTVPIGQYPEDVVRAVSISAVASGLLSEYTFRGNRTEAQRKYINHAVFQGMMGPFRSIVRMDRQERGGGDEDDGDADTPYSTRDVFARGEDTAEQASGSGRSCDVHIYRDVVKALPGAPPGSERELAFATSEEKTPEAFANYIVQNDRRTEGLSQNLSYSLPTAAKTALDPRVRELDYGLVGTSTEEWHAGVVRSLALATVSSDGAVKLSAFKEGKVGAEERRREAEAYLEAFEQRLALYKSEFPGLLYAGTFIISEVIVGPKRHLLQFPLKHVAPQNIFEFVRHFLTYGCGPRVEKMNAENIEKAVHEYLASALQEAVTIIGGPLEGAGAFDQTAISTALGTVLTSLRNRPLLDEDPWSAESVINLARMAVAGKFGKVGQEPSESYKPVAKVASEHILRIFQDKIELVGVDARGKEDSFTEFLQLAIRFARSGEKEAAVRIVEAIAQVEGEKK